MTGYKSGQLSFQSCYDVVQKKGYVCDQGFRGLPKNLKSFKSQDLFKGNVVVYVKTNFSLSVELIASDFVYSLHFRLGVTGGGTRRGETVDLDFITNLG